MRDVKQTSPDSCECCSNNIVLVFVFFFVRVSNGRIPAAAHAFRPLRSFARTLADLVEKKEESSCGERASRTVPSERPAPSRTPCREQGASPHTTGTRRGAPDVRKVRHRALLTRGERRVWSPLSQLSCVVDKKPTQSTILTRDARTSGTSDPTAFKKKKIPHSSPARNAPHPNSGVDARFGTQELSGAAKTPKLPPKKKKETS